MTPINLLEPGAAAKARTNMLKLPGDLSVIIDRLSVLEEGHGHVQAAVVEVTRQFGEEPGAYYQRVDSTIKDFIRKTLGVPTSTKLHYSKFSSRRGVFGFLYLSTHAPAQGYVRQVIAEHSLNPCHAIQALLDLKLKLSYLSDVHKHYEIAPVEYNADLYLGLVYSRTVRTGNDVFEALEYELFFSKEQELVLNLKRMVMECAASADSVSRPVTDSGMLMFDWSGKSYQRVRPLNATTNSDRNYMAFASNNPEARALDLYHNSINYHQTDCLNRIEHLLTRAGIEFSPLVYEATHQVRAFLEGLPTISNPLWLLDTAKHSGEHEAWVSAIATLADKFGVCKVVSGESLPPPADLEVGNASYLVVSPKVKTAGKSKNGSSISKADGEDTQAYNSFWQALNDSRRSPDAQYDYYTSVKLHRFKASVDIICQGYDLDVKKKLSSAAIEKCLQELAIKESIFRDKALIINGATLPEHELQLVSCRSDWKENVYIQVLDVLVGGETIKIERSRRFDETCKGEFNHEFKQLGAVFGREGNKAFDVLWDTAFVIRDKRSNVWLNAYNSIRSPSIIGNTLFDNQERQDEGAAPTRQVRSEVASLPYYLTPTKQNQRHSVFIQDNGTEGALYFVASNKATNGTIAKQSLLYNVVITDEFGARIPVLTHPLGELFFSSFTYDIVRLREAAKSSIFQKIVEVCLHN
ncbi:Uncharacterized protein ALO57_01316 [Pseudomonas coronafaciens pv. oryzae]|uniref:hypothetical protein n=1 Tax=Pseudomonas coronafaciens TaxID=53409 RepID=UPI0006B4C2A5|nr:hypothetical protein [Pseudomonas coronafaciens]KPB49631.1 Uncharacterized protein AC511_2037 [Pseudomonas coronafaciens pv. oryzae]KPY04440.1 Uncharacterized protein ALO57_01316 [Pseudomonas coronafaciens pv. oryzae]RMS98165.1 hypothetical protein ALP55_01035 [Pseudomonas coronafaciens pv. oryzae]